MSRKIKFEVEATVTISGQGSVVFAKNLNDFDYLISEGQKLDGCLIKGADIPRVLDKNGKQRLDIWGIWLESEDDIRHFKEGDIVELSDTQLEDGL